MAFVLLGGPCAREFGWGVERAPRYLRAVIDRKTKKIDILNDLSDKPRVDELVSVYVQVSFEGYTHVDFDIEAGKFANYANASYRHLPDVDGQKLRGTSAWREWADRRAILDEWQAAKTVEGRARLAKQRGPTY